MTTLKKEDTLPAQQKDGGTRTRKPKQLTFEQLIEQLKALNNADLKRVGELLEEIKKERRIEASAVIQTLKEELEELG